MFNSSKFNSANFNTVRLPLGIGSIGRRLPYIIELSTFLEIVSKKRLYNKKIYLNILGKKSKEQIECILFTNKLQEQIKKYFELGGSKRLYNEDNFNILGKKSKEQIECILFTNKLQEQIKEYFELGSSKRLYNEDNFNILGKKCSYQVLKYLDLISKKRENDINNICIYGTKKEELTKSFNIESDIDYTNLFFVLNL